MLLRLSLVCAALSFFCAAEVLCQQPATPGTAPLVQPGAPGQATKTLPSPTVGTAVQEPTAADVKFIQGMIMHHGQAVEMTALMAARSHNPELLELGQRISISQTDEMKFMKLWLEYRGKPLSDDAGMEHMAGMDYMDMSSMSMMPGMLTSKQMEALRKATGPAFDHLFLTGMIQHHTGALTMVKELYATPGAAQDAQLFDFTSDVDNTQQAEIDIMRHMLAKEKQ